MAICQPALPHYRLPVFRALANRPGIDLTVRYATVSGLSNATAAGFDAEPLAVWRAPRTGLHATRGLGDILANADACVFSWNANDLSLWPALRAARRRGVGTVLWGHGFGQPERPLRRRLRDAIGRRADAVLLYDRATADRLAGRGFEPGRIFVAQNALDEQAFHAAAEPWRADADRLARWQREHGFAGRSVLLFVGRLGGKIPTTLLLDAVAAVQRKDSSALFVMVGGPNEEVERLRGEARAAGVEEAVHFAGAVYDEENLAPYFLTARCFAFPRTIGLSLIHAFAYGLPVVTDDDFQHHGPEVRALEPEVNGLFYPSGNAAAFAEQLLRVTQDEALHARLCAGAAETVRDKYNLQTMVDGMEAAIRFAAKRASARRG